MDAKKVDLLSFQKNLNAQFIEIFEAKKEGKIESVQSIQLGLQTDTVHFKFFISLRDLQNISMNNNYEESKLLSSWICGFNQIRGEVFTIMDFRKTIEYVLNKTHDKNYQKLAIDNRIIYLKEYQNEKIGLVIDNINLGYTPDLKLLFNRKDNEENIYWQFNDQLDFDNIIKKENMSLEEYTLLLNIKEKKIVKNYENDVVNDIIFYLISDIYMDDMGKRPIFVLDAENLTKVLINISPLK